LGTRWVSPGEYQSVILKGIASIGGYNAVMDNLRMQTVHRMGQNHYR